MCLQRDTEYYSSSESIDILDLEWPIHQVNDSRLIIACNTCFYPITFEEHVVDEIRNENNIALGIVIPIHMLFRKVGISFENPLEQWKTEVYCPNCGIVLSIVNQDHSHLSDTSFEKISNYKSFGEQIVILWIYPLYRGSSKFAYSRYTEINEPY